MQKQKLRIHECLDGRCPEEIDKVMEIGLSPLEKMAIFVSLQKEIEKSRELIRLAERKEAKA